jgi:hypothetical protein
MPKNWRDLPLAAIFVSIIRAGTTALMLQAMTIVKSEHLLSMLILLLTL